jgi:hypothetical protein
MKKRLAGTVLGLMAESLVENQPEHHRQTVIVALNKMSDVAIGFNDGVAASFEDRRLTPEGQAVNAAKATTAALAALDAFDVDIQKFTDRAMNVEKALRTKVASAVPKNVPTETLREVRDELRQLPPPERLNIYRTTSDPIVLAAIETAPPSLGDKRADGTRRLESFVDPTELAAAQMERAEAADPAGATMHELRGLAEVYRLAANSVRREIMDAAGVQS